MKISYSVIIPVFNEELNLNPLYTQLTKVMQDIGDNYEIIFIDDGSIDSSFKILQHLHENDNRVKVIRFTRNFGQHPAVMAGFDLAQGEVMITLDADLQNPPEEIPKLIKKLDEGYEVVLGIFKQRKHSLFRKVGSAFSKMVLSKIVPVGMSDISAFRAMRYCVVDKLKLFNERNKFLDGLICWMGFKIGRVEVEHDKRFAGKTKYNLFKLVNMWFDMVVSLTSIPLKIATISGIGLGIISLLMALYYIIRYLTIGYGVVGFATTVILITFFAGVQLFCLGIMGEYIGRMNKEVKKKPEYIVREKLGMEE